MIYNSVCLFSGENHSILLLPFGKFGSRVQFGEFSDSNCLNCESLDHDSLTCPFSPVIRLNIDKYQNTYINEHNIYIYISQLQIWF